MAVSIRTLNLTKLNSPSATANEACAAADDRVSTKKCSSQSRITNALSRASIKVKMGRPATAAKTISQSQAAIPLLAKWRAASQPDQQNTTDSPSQAITETKWVAGW